MTERSPPAWLKLALLAVHVAPLVLTGALWIGSLEEPVLVEPSLLQWASLGAVSIGILMAVCWLVARGAFTNITCSGKTSLHLEFASKPVHCLSTRFEGVSYRVSMLIGEASFSSIVRRSALPPQPQLHTRRLL